MESFELFGSYCAIRRGGGREEGLESGIEDVRPEQGGGKEKMLFFTYSQLAGS